MMNINSSQNEAMQNEFDEDAVMRAVTVGDDVGCWGLNIDLACVATLYRRTLEHTRPQHC